MKHRKLFFILLISLVGSAVYAQTIYHFTYKSPLATDTAHEEAFFIQSDVGSGTVRISRTKPGNKQIIFEMTFQQQFAFTESGITDTSWIICRGSNPLVKIGDRKTRLPAFTYWFKLNQENGQYIPWAVTTSDKKNHPDENNFLTTSLVADPVELKSLVSKFFLPAEAFYKNLYDPKKRGGLLSDDERSTKIHLLIVASTKDTSIGNSALFDVKRAIKTFSAVAKALTLENNIIIDTICGENFNRTNILKAINNITPRKGRDIVIFYYSGHGFTNPQQPKKTFPFLDLLYPLQKPRPEPKDSALNIEDIYTMLKQKGARLNLVISDCCNNRIGDKPIKKDAPPGHRGEIDITKWNKNNIKSLFMTEKPLSILATAASKGEKAACNDRYGGFFSNNFLLALTSYFSYEKSTALWSQIFADAQKQTIWQANHTYCPEDKKLCHQTPPPPKVN